MLISSTEGSFQIWNKRFDIRVCSPLSPRSNFEGPGALFNLGRYI
jgi:hypothetical protein